MLEHIYAFNLCNASSLCGIELYVACGLVSVPNQINDLQEPM